MGTNKQVAAGYRRQRDNVMAKARRTHGEVRSIFVQHARVLNRYAIKWNRRDV